MYSFFQYVFPFPSNSCNKMHLNNNKNRPETAVVPKFPSGWQQTPLTTAATFHLSHPSGFSHGGLQHCYPGDLCVIKVKPSPIGFSLGAAILCVLILYPYNNLYLTLARLGPSI